VTIKAGDTVRWTNHGPSDHTTTSDARVWDSGTLRGSGGSFQFVFPQAGTFPYHCTLHPPSLYPNFTGMVTVNP
jgi:plastocyanin